MVLVEGAFVICFFLLLLRERRIFYALIPCRNLTSTIREIKDCIDKNNVELQPPYIGENCRVLSLLYLESYYNTYYYYIIIIIIIMQI